MARIIVLFILTILLLAISFLFFRRTADAAQGEPVTLTWTDQSDNEMRFIVQRRIGPTGKWKEIGRLDWNETRYTDYLTVSGQYCYRIQAANMTRLSGFSEERCIEFRPAVLSVPILTVSTESGFPLVRWKADPRMTGIHLDRRQSTGAWGSAADVSAADGVWHDHKSSLTWSWCYRARFYNLVGDSVLSQQVCTVAKK